LHPYLVGSEFVLVVVAQCEPKLEEYPLCFIYDYPKSQSALAKVQGQVAHRFEMYMYGDEVANGQLYIFCNIDTMMIHFCQT
jgi:lysyl-tRNA synthetase class 2